MRKISSILLLAVLASCHSHAPANDQAKMNQLADRSCRAISIRQQRYTLADKIRFANDTLGTTKDEKVKARLQSSLKVYLKQKDSLLKVSLALADTIRMQLDSMMPYTDKAAQKRFSTSLNNLLAKKGCPVVTGRDSLPK
ncbi:MAG TPA: hypothetical protein VHC47_08695 [Mucilaginibacter sp.]|nr:hypothetical protein [Mucilaginibacter sp.]